MKFGDVECSTELIGVELSQRHTKALARALRQHVKTWPGVDQRPIRIVARRDPGPKASWSVTIYWPVTNHAGLFYPGDELADFSRGYAAAVRAHQPKRNTAHKNKRAR